MKHYYDPVLSHGAEWPLAMEQVSVPRSHELDLSDRNDIDDWYMIPNDPNLVVGYEYPRVPSFMDDIADAPYFIPQTPEESGMDFGVAPVENGEFLLVDHPVIDGGRLLDTEMNSDNGYMLYNSYQPVDVYMASPTSVGSTPGSSPWEFVEPFPCESVWDLSALHPDSCNITERRHSKPLNWHKASNPNAYSNDDMEESSSLLSLSLMDSFRYPCPHKTCTKSFKRKEHAKRHYITKHKRNSRTLQCEFCGKDTFTRTDNLNAHRRLHARQPPKHNSGVHFVPAALELFQKGKKPTSYKGKVMSFFV